ncbi:exodeoxyribonuclease VII, large subunit [Methanohalobium evestigatum Z-7303]|uniref:Exodeoxyribonuclease VII, large subunit n=1 Tax=Methanohalobium evestigatum (strain ATCC BAA-1072 / DSM 3721 / NBRC 107634 / OCM 161 / Z-7303) TaxID=644295 RepID=D7EB75_METEZ|nr:exodeoxyribonuclease VII large subunit [Methanohalobium evestigatum]ADI74592.1 exodeoxyribonuclease VII, large subunit [Methanohalobium evestigatum Z-7303]
MIYTVSELNTHIKQLLKNELSINQIWVRGEISNFKKHTSGHYYFTLKDRNNQISCVSFRSTNRNIKFEPEDSMQVLIFGSIDVYKVRGQYQLNVFDIRPDGIGELYKAYEQLKNQLDSEGFFKDTNKKSIPEFPHRIGVATSTKGAAIHDIMNVVKRRFPVDILISPTIVQGEQSASSIVDSIEKLNQCSVDVIILGRGGGSLEDLWSFNEEIVARAIYSSQKPVISAVGHETDYTIADFTADMRAPTPSAAAELVVPDYMDIIRRINNLSSRMENAITNKITEKSTQLYYVQKRMHPERLYDNIRQNQQQVDELLSRMEYSIKNVLKSKKSSLQIHANHLQAVSPLKTLERGYSITTDSKNGSVIKSIDNVSNGDSLDIIVKDGIIKCSVKNTSKKSLKHNSAKD